MCGIIFCVLCVITAIGRADDYSDEYSEPFTSNAIEFGMKYHKVVPDVIRHIPDLPLKVKFRNAAALGGNIIPPSRAKFKPKIYWEEYDHKRLYTISMFDADYEKPSVSNTRLKISNGWNNWLVVNVPGNNPKKGKTLAEYVPPIPANGTGLHRFIILVFRQRIEMPFKEVTRLGARSDPLKRANFSILRFSIAHKLGKPLAGNFFRSSYDDYVPTVEKTLNTSDYITPSKFDFDESKYQFMD